jgi:two-component system, response regulator PdtaR
MMNTPDSTPAHEGSLRILIVEDEAIVSLFLQSLLVDMGHRVTGIAPSLRTALAIVAGARSDLAIVDIGLAGDGGDGIDTAVALRERHGIPSVLMTGIRFDDLPTRVRRAQPLALLMKPYTEADVDRALTAAVSQLKEATT